MQRMWELGVDDADPTQAASGDFPHILFYGPSGAGKKVSSCPAIAEWPALKADGGRPASCALSENCMVQESRR
jgi:hypothetical protein